jgi:UTP:GlnB (protein PII) uridylyltransferase
VGAYGDEPERTLVRVRARDQIGLLTTICRWFSDNELSVESVHATTDGETARDVFLVNGNRDAAALEHYLGGR